jgi:hypothetical protein
MGGKCDASRYAGRLIPCHWDPPENNPVLTSPPKSLIFPGSEPCRLALHPDSMPDERLLTVPEVIDQLEKEHEMDARIVKLKFYAALIKVSNREMQRD